MAKGKRVETCSLLPYAFCLLQVATIKIHLCPIYLYNHSVSVVEYLFVFLGCSYSITGACRVDVTHLRSRYCLPTSGASQQKTTPSDVGECLRFSREAFMPIVPRVCPWESIPW
jgi:hypothetical protein